MAAVRAAVVLCLLLAVQATEERGSLRPSFIRHSLIAKKEVEAAPVAAVPAEMDEPVVPAEEPVQVETTSEDKDKETDASLVQLHHELSELKQRKTNVKQLEQALSADVSLLRESATLERVSTSARGRKAAERQVKQMEEVVKAASSMVRENRQAAVEEARAALRHANEVHAMAEQISAEATEQLRSIAAPKAAPKPTEPAPAVALNATDADSDDGN
eukprot:gnl/TRDRNA2_/TRDRNA2_166690_c1_seq2.p1 gnl/TRDRNA2_/TRDRNA2_166690_c1~~gnl/TRDRNA2_/TRDRNA2_166690_c1_seq2.p1  ORF type:complete len:217 (+),score=72.91 gnl/TRDRNA2_/TRDRNA2_166690_c1_seq2:62-712(+)